MTKRTAQSTKLKYTGAQVKAAMAAKADKRKQTQFMDDPYSYKPKCALPRKAGDPSTFQLAEETFAPLSAGC